MLDSREKLLALFAPCLNCLVHLLIADRIRVAEAKILQFAADLAHSQAVRDGSVDIECFLCNFLLAFRRQVFESPHVMQAVGKLNEDHADIIHHGQHHLTQILRLLLLTRGEINSADLGDAFDDVRHLFTKFFADVNDRDRRIFDRVVQEAGGDGRWVHFHFGQHAGYFQRMH